MNELQTMQQRMPFSQMKELAEAFADSGLFGFKSSSQALALMAMAEAEGRHPAIVARDYHIVLGKPVLKTEAMLARFQESGGSVEWVKLDEKEAEGQFSHPKGASIKIKWTIEMATKAGLVKADSAWMKYPRAMLRNRVASEAIKASYPQVLAGTFHEDEVMEIKEKDITPTSDEKKMTKQGFIAMKAQQAAERSVNVIDSVAEEKMPAIEQDKELKYNEIQILELRDAKKVDEATFNSWLLKSGFSSLEEADITTINKMGKYLESL